MTLRWTYPFDGDLTALNLRKLADEIMPEFVLYGSEVSVSDNEIIGVPKMTMWTYSIPEKVFINEVRVESQFDKNEVLVQIDLSNLFIRPLLIPALAILTFNIGFVLLGILAYILLVSVNGLMLWFSFLGVKDDIRKKIKTFANET